jgi:protein-S-isoprenylcysteine O-methyltransferase Ste14
MIANLLKSILHNIGVVIVGFIFAFIGTRIDLLLGIKNFESLITIFLGSLLLIIGFLIRVWATYYFYKNRMGVIKLKPQEKLLTEGPFAFSRNPLYLGGNVFIFFGTVFVLGSPSGIALTFVVIFITNFMIKREEKQLEQTFGEEWSRYKKQVRRWF